MIAQKEKTGSKKCRGPSDTYGKRKTHSLGSNGVIMNLETPVLKMVDMLKNAGARYMSLETALKFLSEELKRNLRESEFFLGGLMGSGYLVVFEKGGKKLVDFQTEKTKKLLGQK
jgi:hypothetical protein